MKGRIASRNKHSRIKGMLSSSETPEHQQTAALCVRKKDGEPQVLLITSRGTGRWIIPKGWLMRGKTAGEAALIEAWEEAGVKSSGQIQDPIGSYAYKKIKDDGSSLDVEVLVFLFPVKKLSDDFPEAGQRKRKWFRPDDAAELVDEPELQSILRSL